MSGIAGTRWASRGLVSSALAAALVGLVACGGGSDGDSVKVQLTLDPASSIRETISIGGTLGSRILSGRATGDLASLDGKTIYVAIDDPARLLALASPQTSPDGSFWLTLTGRPLMTAGHFTGILKLHVSLEAGGGRPFGGSPLIVPYDVTVGPARPPTPSSYIPRTVGTYLDYQHQAGSGAPSTLRRQITQATATSITTAVTTATVNAMESLQLSGNGAYRASQVSCPAAGGGCTIMAFSPASVELPTDTTPGFWERTQSSTTIGASFAYTLTRVATVDGFESITVPAGTYRALRITTAETAGSVETVEVAWWVDGLGRVKWLRHPPSDPTPTDTWVLIGSGTAPIP